MKADARLSLQVEPGTTNLGERHNTVHCCRVVSHDAIPRVLMSCVRKQCYTKDEALLSRWPVWCFALGFGGLAQLLAGMWEAYRGKMFGATAFSSYGAFWLSLGIYGIINDSGLFTLEGPETKGLEAVRSHLADVMTSTLHVLRPRSDPALTLCGQC